MMKRKKTRSLPIVALVLTAVALLTVFADGVCADDSWEKIRSKGTLVVGFCAQYPPFEFKNEKGGFEGFDVDLANALGKHLGVKVVLRDGEWQGLIAGMKKGDYDMLITCMGKTTARKQNVNFSDVYFDLTEVIVVRKDEKGIQGVEGLRGKTVGAQMATSSERALDQISDKVGSKKKYNYTTEAFLDLKFKRIDALICGVAYAIVQIQKDPSFRVVGDPLHSTPIVMALPKGADALTGRINAALGAVRSDGTYQKIYKRWIRID